MHKKKSTYDMVAETIVALSAILSLVGAACGIMLIKNAKSTMKQQNIKEDLYVPGQRLAKTNTVNMMKLMNQRVR